VTRAIREYTNLAVQVWFCGFRGIQLETFPNALSENVARRVGLHDFGHSLLDQRLHAREPVAVCRPEIVRQIHSDHDTRRGRVDTH
jgi:hypothetical protein